MHVSMERLQTYSREVWEQVKTRKFISNKLTIHTCHINTHMWIIPAIHKHIQARAHYQKMNAILVTSLTMALSLYPHGITRLAVMQRSSITMQLYK